MRCFYVSSVLTDKEAWADRFTAGFGGGRKVKINVVNLRYVVEILKIVKWFRSMERWRQVLWEIKEGN